MLVKFQWVVSSSTKDVLSLLAEIECVPSLHLTIADAQVNETKSSVDHAELVAIRKLETWCRSNDLNLADVMAESVLYVTVEPCIMCAAALRFCLPKPPASIIYGARNERFGGCGSVLNIHVGSSYVDPSMVAPDSYRQLNCTPGIQEERAIAMLKQFYSQENMNAPEEIRKIKQPDSTKRKRCKD